LIALHESAQGVSFAVRVHPRAKKNAITGVIGDALKISITAPPVEGRANQALIDFFAECIGVPKGSLEVISGSLGRNKVVRVCGLAAAELATRLSAHLPGN
jgi:hypothetical protein